VEKDLTGGLGAMSSIIIKGIRHVVRLFGMIVAMPLSLPFILIGWVAIGLDRFSEVSVFLSRVPFYIGEYLRLYYYKCTLVRCGNRVVFKFGSTCQYRKTAIGNNVLIGYFDLLGEVDIGDDVLIGSYVNFTSGLRQHSFENPRLKICEQPSEGRKLITIGSDVWIGNNSVICNDVGDRCVVGAGSIVIDRLESHGVYAGNPAKFIRHID
jgi:virginiamycin A acetyltransferase